MANARSYPSPAVIRSMIALAKELGLDPAGFEVAPGGVLRVLQRAPAPQDEVTKWLDQV